MDVAQTQMRSSSDADEKQFGCMGDAYFFFSEGMQCRCITAVLRSPDADALDLVKAGEAGVAEIGKLVRVA